jgi:hypothetical protein
MVRNQPIISACGPSQKNTKSNTWSGKIIDTLKPRLAKNSCKGLCKLCNWDILVPAHVAFSLDLFMILKYIWEKVYKFGWPEKCCFLGSDAVQPSRISPTFRRKTRYVHIYSYTLKTQAARSTDTTIYLLNCTALVGSCSSKTVYSCWESSWFESQSRGFSCYSSVPPGIFRDIASIR